MLAEVPDFIITKTLLPRLPVTGFRRRSSLFSANTVNSLCLTLSFFHSVPSLAILSKMNTEGYIQRIQIYVREDISRYCYKYILDIFKRVRVDILSQKIFLVFLPHHINMLRYVMLCHDVANPITLQKKIIFPQTIGNMPFPLFIQFMLHIHYPFCEALTNVLN